MPDDKIVHAAPVPPFVTFVASAVPMVFDNSMSYYEALCALWKWMQDNLVDVINNNASVTEQYIEYDLHTRELFIELKSYVDNYFDNLDVQEEINNKLDAMVEAGTLQEIITEYIQSNVAWVFDTVADMKASTNLINGSYAQTLGYYAKNDGGGGLYYIDNTGTADEMTIIAIDSLRAHLIYFNEINTKQCGLKGDNTTDETVKLNNFFKIDSSVNKIVSKGVYLTSDTVFIGGIWRQNSGNNGSKKVVFDNASIHYTGTANDYAVIIHEMFKYEVDGLCITRDSNANVTAVIGCWYSSFNNFDISSLELTNNNNILGDLPQSTVAIANASFNNIFCKGQLLVSTADTSYINSVNFYNSIIDSHNYQYCVVYSGAKSKQEMNFYNTDLSYATTAVFYIPTTQTGKASINCFGCYFDSDIPMFYQHNKNGVIFNSFASNLPADSQHGNILLKYSDFIDSLNLNHYYFRVNNLPTEKVNYAKNGDMSYNGSFTGNYNDIMGSTSSKWTKTWVTSDLNINGNARKCTIIDYEEPTKLTVMGVSAPRTGVYSGYIRLKVVAGSFTMLQLGMSAKYAQYTDIGNDEVLLSIARDTVFNAGDTLYFDMTFTSPSSDLAIEIYEMGIVAGKLYLPYAPLHKNAIITA